MIGHSHPRPKTSSWQADTRTVDPGKVDAATADVATDDDLAQEQAVDGLLPAPVVEIGGRIGPEPTRYGDWEKNGRCIDF